MRNILLLLFLGFVNCSSGKSIHYTGSTPAAPVVRSFLGISQSDSVDFIRWKLEIDDVAFTLSCQFGVGKPNTNGFLKGGKKVDFKGTVVRKNNVFRLTGALGILTIREINPDLLQILNMENEMLVGNGGWSYTLNSLTPQRTRDFHPFTGSMPPVSDSVEWIGRTPCGVPGVVEAGKECFKLKWRIILTGDNVSGNAGTYRIYSTAWRPFEPMTGKWRTVTGVNRQPLYILQDQNGKDILRLLRLDGNILLFVDQQERLLVGDHDFSYTLNRRI